MYQPVPGPPVLPPRPTPAPVVVVRVLVIVQLVGLLLVGFLALVLAAFSGTGLDSEDELTRGFAGLGVVLGVIVAVATLLAGVALGVPLFLVRGGRPRGCTASLVFLVVLESTVGVLFLAAVVAAAVDGDPGNAVMPFLGALLPAAVVVLAMLPVSRAWAAAPPVAPPGWTGPPVAPPPWGGPPPAGPWGPG